LSGRQGRGGEEGAAIESYKGSVTAQPDYEKKRGNKGTVQIEQVERGRGDKAVPSTPKNQSRVVAQKRGRKRCAGSDSSGDQGERGEGK